MQTSILFFFSGIRLSWNKYYGTFKMHLVSVLNLFYCAACTLITALWCLPRTLDRCWQCRYTVTLPFPCVPGTCSPAPGWSSTPAIQRAPRPQHHPLHPVMPCGGRVSSVASPCPGSPAPAARVCAGGCVPTTTVAACSSLDALWHICPLPVQCPGAGLAWSVAGDSPGEAAPAGAHAEGLAPSEVHICFPSF